MHAFRVLFGLCAINVIVLTAAEAQTTPNIPVIQPDTGVTTGWTLVSGAVTNPPSLYGVAGGGAVELGQTVALTVNFFGAGADQTYQWQKDGADIPGATTVSYTINAAATSDAGTYAVEVTNGGGTSVATTTVTVKPLAAPVITQQPSSWTANVGQQVSFGFSATGSYPRTYQWRKNGTNIPGATQALYTIAAVATADAAGYSVVVSNSQGSATSSAASLTVNAAIAPVIYSGSLGDGSTTQGYSYSFYTSLSSGSTPYTYQWYKNGTAIPGATQSQLTFNSVALSDAGKYYYTVTNPAGSATSREATFTVNPATPVTISTQPQSQTIYEGQNLNLYVYANGSSPVTFQWQKDGIAILGATGSGYTINKVAKTDAGGYSVVITNIVGSVTSNVATVTVNAAVAPTITTAPVGQSVAYGGSINLSVVASGTTPFQYQWFKNGTPISGATYSSYSSYYSATPADSGQYSVTITNVAGSVSSTVVTVTVAAAAAPTITSQPADAQVAAGGQASFSVSASTSGTGALSVQWYKDGIPISGATSGSYSINQVKSTDAGRYSATVTGAGGAVTSSSAVLTVLPPSAPVINSWSGSIQYVTFGSSCNLYVYLGQTGGTLSYQWAKDGVPIPGATSSNFNLPSVAPSDIGTYTLTISSDGGVVTSPPMRLRAAGPNGYNNQSEPWLDVGRVGDVVYFLATSPARIERYDLAAGKWLATTSLGTQTPTAFAAASEGVYIAYGRALVRRPLDLSTETGLSNTSANITQLFVFDKYVYFNGGTSSTGFTTLDRTTLQPGPTVTLGSYFSTYHQLAFAASSRRGFGIVTDYSPRNLGSFTVNTDGTIAAGASTSNYLMPSNYRVYVVPGDQYVADSGGAVYRASDLSYVGSYGESFTDLAFLSDGTSIVLRGGAVYSAAAGTYLANGKTTLSQPAYRVFTRGTTIYAFGAAASQTPFQVSSFDVSALASTSTVPSTSFASGRFSVDDAFLGSSGLVYVFSRTLQGLIPWDSVKRQFLSVVPLRSAPNFISHQPGNNRVLISYPDAVISQVPLSSGASETVLANVGQNVRAIVDLGGTYMLNVSNAQDSGDARIVLGASGGPYVLTSQIYNPLGQAWQSSTRRIYSTGAFSPTTVQYETFNASGTLDTSTGASKSSSASASAPFRFASDGALFATANGAVFNADLSSAGTLANNIIDGAWLPNSLYSIRALNGATQVQQWNRSNYLLAGTTTVQGTPVRILQLSNSQVLVVTAASGYLGMTILNSDLTVATPASVAGYYFAKLAPGASAGNLAAMVRSDGTGVLLVNLPGLHDGLVCTTLLLDSSGSFVVNARDLATSDTRVVSGTIAPDGTISGSIPSLNLTFVGAASKGNGGCLGFYQAPAIDCATGTVYAIVGFDGSIVAVAQSPGSVDGGTATISSTGKATISMSGTTHLTVAIDGAGKLTASADAGSLSNLSFVGLNSGLSPTDRLANISTRGRVGTGEDALIAGFVVTGTSPRPILIRASGPPLTKFGVTDPLANPTLALYQGQTQLAASDDWYSESSAMAISTTGDALGAFKLPSPGTDAALLVTLAPGNYTAEVGGANIKTGISLVEVYDAGADSSTSAPRVSNISTRGRVGTGQDVLIAGIIVNGNRPKKMLIRAVGPTMKLLGISDPLLDPVLSIMAGQTTLLTNDDWFTQTNGVTPADISKAAVSVGAFPLPYQSKDSAVIVTLQPGGYTAVVSGKGSASGVALVEVYELAN